MFENISIVKDNALVLLHIFLNYVCLQVINTNFQDTYALPLFVSISSLYTNIAYLYIICIVSYCMKYNLALIL